jgi:hypothetical protein
MDHVHPGVQHSGARASFELDGLSLTVSWSLGPR